MAKHSYDYYEVSIPGDLADTLQELGQQAIREAEERTKLHAMPCEWTAEPIRGTVGDYEVMFRVRRKRRTPARVA